MSEFPAINASSSEIEKILSENKRIDCPIILDSAPYTPYKWSVFFIYSAIIGASLWLLYNKFVVDDVQPYSIQNSFLIAAYVGVLFVPIVAVFYLSNLLFPTRLLIDEIGVTLSGSGKVKRLKWIEIESVTMKEELIRKKTVFRMRINSQHDLLRWGYYLGVNPTDLKNFLMLQKNLFASSQPT